MRRWPSSRTLALTGRAAARTTTHGRSVETRASARHDQAGVGPASSNRDVERSHDWIKVCFRLPRPDRLQSPRATSARSGYCAISADSSAASSLRRAPARWIGVLEANWRPRDGDESGCRRLGLQSFVPRTLYCGSLNRRDRIGLIRPVVNSRRIWNATSSH